MSKGGISMATIEAALNVDHLTQSFSHVDRSIQITSNHFTVLNNQVSDSAKKVNQFAGVIKKAAEWTGTYLKEMLNDGVNQLANIQTAEIGYKFLLGEEQGTAFIEQLAQFVQTTPFDFNEINNGAQNLMKMGVSADQVLPIMQGIGDTVAALGGGAEEINTITRTLGTIQAAGKVTKSDLESLSMAGVNALDLLANQAGVSGEQMRQAIESGAVGAEQAVSGLAAGMQEQFGGAMLEVENSLTGAINSLNQAKTDAGAKLIEPFMTGIVDVVQGLTGFVEMIPAILAPALEAFLPLTESLAELFDIERFYGFFDFVTVSLFALATLLSSVFDIVLWGIGVLIDNWPIIAGMLMALVAFYLPTLISGLWQALSALLMKVGVWMLLNMPVLIFMAVVGALIAVIMYLGLSTGEVLGFIMGLFFTVGAFIYNIIAGLWNAIVSFAEFIAQAFMDSFYFVQKIAYDLAYNFLDLMERMLKGVEDFAGGFMTMVLDAINQVLGGINWLIRALNRIPGFNISEIGKFDSSNVNALSEAVGRLKDNLQEPVRQTLDFSSAKLDRWDYGDAYNKGYSMGESWGNGIDSAISGALDKTKVPDEQLDPNDLGIDGAFNMNQGLNPGGAAQAAQPNQPISRASKSPTVDQVNKVDEVGKINDEVDIASEDLKLMRELAELRTIQNFVSLTPTVQVKTGDIKEEADVRKLIDAIEQSLQDEIASSAKGVYAL